jgi:1,2-diacylglycerol 3-alpha-glucosyltransferase
LKMYDSAIVGASSHMKYLVKLGVREEAVFFGYDVVDNCAFNPEIIPSFKRVLSSPYYLSINRFVQKKNLLFLLDSYAAYRQKVGSSAWDLVLCGDGELRRTIEEKIEVLGLKNSVHLPGFLQQDELLPYFAHASCFIHSSLQEQWGLVVNEAMAAALPVLVSNRCGCFDELVVEGSNGFGFDPTNQQELTNLMIKIGSANVDLKKMGDAAFKHIQKFSPDYFAQGLHQAIQFAAIVSRKSVKSKN